MINKLYDTALEMVSGGTEPQVKKAEDAVGPITSTTQGPAPEQKTDAAPALPNWPWHFPKESIDARFIGSKHPYLYPRLCEAAIGTGIGALAVGTALFCSLALPKIITHYRNK